MRVNLLPESITPLADNEADATFVVRITDIPDQFDFVQYTQNVTDLLISKEYTIKKLTARIKELENETI